MNSKTRNIIFYLILFGGGFAFMGWISGVGSGLELQEDIINPMFGGSHWTMFVENTKVNFFTPFAILLAQIITILMVARLCGYLFKKIGQPGVIGEIVAGIILGPSLLGHLFPEYFNVIFPDYSLNNLKTISNIGLILFMFVVGMELDLKVLKSKISESVAISQAGIVFPFALGMGLSYFLYPKFVDSTVPFLPFALFIGVSLSITAFPVLARIAQERGIHKTNLGTVVLASAAINDIMAWCILAVIIAITKAGNITSSLFTIAFAIGYVVLMIKVVKPFLKKISDLHHSRENLNKGVVAIFFLVLLVSSFCTEMIGIHALFGAFMAGLIMPEQAKFREIFVEKIEDVASLIFLPLFFVYTGLRTKIGLLNDVTLWESAAWIIGIAVVGKFVGSAIAAKIMGKHNWSNSFIVGALMNTRGLMELVAINIGYDLGVISEEIFVMLVLMALITTFMTSPILALINRISPNKEIILEEIKRKTSRGIFKVLVAVGNPASGKHLLKIAKYLLDGQKKSLEITALHVTAGSDTSPLHSDKYMHDSFVEIDNEAERLGIVLKKEYEMSDNVEDEILEHVNDFDFDFFLIGAGISYSKENFLKETSAFSKISWLNKGLNSIFKQRIRFYPQDLIKDKTNFFVENSNCSMGIFVNRNFTDISDTAVVLSSVSDSFLLHYAKRLLHNANTREMHIVIYDRNKILDMSEEAKTSYNLLKNEFGNRITISLSSNKSQIAHTNSFMLISYQGWNSHISENPKILASIPSTLIIDKK